MHQETNLTKPKSASRLASVCVSAANFPWSAGGPLRRRSRFRPQGLFFPCSCLPLPPILAISRIHFSSIFSVAHLSNSVRLKRLDNDCKMRLRGGGYLCENDEKRRTNKQMRRAYKRGTYKKRVRCKARKEGKRSRTVGEGVLDVGVEPLFREDVSSRHVETAHVGA